jgi:hypothetical protein
LLKPIEDLLVLAHTIDNALENTCARKTTLPEHLEQLVVDRTSSSTRQPGIGKLTMPPCWLVTSPELREQETTVTASAVDLTTNGKTHWHRSTVHSLTARALLHDIGKRVFLTKLAQTRCIERRGMEELMKGIPSMHINFSKIFHSWRRPWIFLTITNIGMAMAILTEWGGNSRRRAFSLVDDLMR